MDNYKKRELAEIYSQGFEEETNQVLRDNNIIYGNRSLNVASKIRFSRLAEKVREFGDNYVSIEDKQSYILYCKNTDETYIFTSKSNERQNYLNYKKGLLSYITSLITLCNDEDKNVQLSFFDEKENETADKKELKKQAIEKTGKFWKIYGDRIKNSNIFIVTRNNSLKNTLNLNVIKYYKNMEIASQEDWGIYVPVDFSYVDTSNTYDKLPKELEDVNNSIKKKAKLKIRKVKMK